MTRERIQELKNKYCVDDELERENSRTVSDVAKLIAAIESRDLWIEKAKARFEVILEFADEMGLNITFRHEVKQLLAEAPE